MRFGKRRNNVKVKIWHRKDGTLYGTVRYRRQQTAILEPSNRMNEFYQAITDAVGEYSKWPK